MNPATIAMAPCTSTMSGAAADTAAQEAAGQPGANCSRAEVGMGLNARYSSPASAPRRGRNVSSVVGGRPRRNARASRYDWPLGASRPPQVSWTNEGFSLNPVPGGRGDQCWFTQMSRHSWLNLLMRWSNPRRGPWP